VMGANVDCGISMNVSKKLNQTGALEIDNKSDDNQ